LGLGLVVAGLFGFLPVLGFWMIPLGLLIVWADLAPLVRRPTRGEATGARGTPDLKEDRIEGSDTMETPLELSFTNMDPDADLDALVREKVSHLEKLLGRITSCHVYVRAPHQRHRKGNLYGVRIEVRVPGTELFVDSGKGDAPAHEHPQVAIRDAFHAMERRVKKWKQKAAHDVKLHEGPLQGRIAEIHHDRGFGQIIATDNRLIYFHRNSVVGGDFDELRPRDTVELVVQTGESEIGPQASTVRPIGALKYDPT
jgi:ribosome-associated translation inhibitor RaiA/cold shock CspA family protein